MPNLVDLPILIQIFLLIFAVLMLLVGASVVRRMVKALFGKKDRD